jgi:hypothetical protein
MKRLFLIILVSLSTFSVYAQRDTIVIMLDKNKDYLYFNENNRTTDKYYNYSSEDAGQEYFSVNIKSHYLGPDSVMFAYDARVYLVQIKEGYKKWNIDKYEISIPRSELSSFELITTDAINKASNNDEIENLLYFNSQGEKVQYLVFKDDLKNKEITLYRIDCYRNEVYD